jgi:hypothetical protein
MMLLDVARCCLKYVLGEVCDGLVAQVDGLPAVASHRYSLSPPRNRTGTTFPALLPHVASAAGRDRDRPPPRIRLATRHSLHPSARITMPRTGLVDAPEKDSCNYSELWYNHEL